MVSVFGRPEESLKQAQDVTSLSQTNSRQIFDKLASKFSRGNGFWMILA
jgi:hypothetical protein